MTRTPLSASALAALVVAPLRSPLPSDSVSQISTATQDSVVSRRRRQKQPQAAYDDDDLTDPLASDDENTLRKCFLILKTLF